MKKALKVLGVLAALGAVAIGGMVAKISMGWPPSFPDTPTPEITASEDPEVIAQGEYLVNSIAHCSSCHSPAEDYFALAEGEVGGLAGGHEWHMGPLGTVRSANITQDEASGIGAWSDGEIARALRHGIGKDGEPLLFMFAVGPLDDEDLTAIVSYLRTVEPVSNEIADHEIGLLGKFLFQGPMDFFAKPHTYTHGKPYVPAGEASAERGAYLVYGPGNCSGCHTSYGGTDSGIEFTGPELAGSRIAFPDEFEPDFEYAAPNLTPDAEFGHIAGWDEARFTERFKTGRAFKGSPMPWESYRNLSDADIKSIWMFLESLEPAAYDVGPARREAGTWKAPE